MKALRDIRVIPVVLIAIFGLAVLKVAGLVIDGGYVFDYQPETTKRSWAQESFNFPTGRSDITGSVHETPKEEAADYTDILAEIADASGGGTLIPPRTVHDCRGAVRLWRSMSANSRSTTPSI